MRGSSSSAPARADATFDIALERAARIIRAGGIVAHPTEGLWGLACDPFAASAVMRILRMKRRPVEKGLIVIGASRDTFARELGALSPCARQTVLGTWPGPVTWVVPNRRFPKWITGRRATVAIRVPGHVQARRLCEAVGGPIVSTSANPAGRAPARSALAVRVYFRDTIDDVLSGELGGRSGASEIRVAGSGHRLRDAVP